MSGHQVAQTPQGGGDVSSSIWRDICDAVWICTTEKNVNVEDRAKKTFGTLVVTGVPEDMIYVNVVPHGEYETGHLSCTANHLCAMRRALARGHTTILVVEDDLSLYSAADVHRSLGGVKSFLRSSRAKEWDILYLGAFVHRIERGPARHTVRAASCFGAHAYLANEGFMRRMVQYTPHTIVQHAEALLSGTSQGHVLASRWWTIRQNLSIDILLLLLSDCGIIHSYALYPSIFYQRSYSVSALYRYSLEPVVAVAVGDSYNSLLVILLVILALVATCVLATTVVISKNR